MCRSESSATTSRRPRRQRRRTAARPREHGDRAGFGPLRPRDRRCLRLPDGAMLAGRRGLVGVRHVSPSGWSGAVAVDVCGRRSVRRAGGLSAVARPATNGCSGVGEHVVDRPVADDAPFLQHGDLVVTRRSTARSWLTMIAENPRMVAQLAEEVDHRIPHRRVDAGRRLVGDQHRGPEHERPGERDPLPLPGAQLVRVLVEHAERQVDGVEHRRRTLPGGAPAVVARRVRRSASATFSATVSVGSSVVDASCSRIPDVERDLGDVALLRACRSEWPSTVASPPVIRGPGSVARCGSPRPGRTAASVDLPDPVSPRTPRISPGSTRRLDPAERDAALHSAPARDTRPTGR